MDLPDLNDVRTFVLVAQAGTLTGAAKELELPASTVSRSLTRLEKHLSVLLVQRGPRGMVLTDFGKEYLQTCRKALRTLRDAGDLLEIRRERPSGVIKIVCPVTMARNILAPLLPVFLGQYPELRVGIEPYAAGWDQEPREDVDVFFKLRAPRDSIRRVRAYPGTKRGLFASAEYLAIHSAPAVPEDLTAHTCIGSGVWKLRRSVEVAAPNIAFRVVTSDPGVHLTLAAQGLGIAILPLYMARWPDKRDRLTPVLQEWIPEPITVCALFSGPARLTPKVQVLLDFLGEYMGTDRDPRLRGLPAKGMFTDPMIAETSGP